MSATLVSPHQYSSAVFDAPADVVFELVKPCTFKWWNHVSTATKDAETDMVNVCYADNTIQKIHLVEFSLLEMKVSWEVVESEPAAPTFSAVHTITCHKVTTTNQCFVSWSTNFSSDATPEVIEDAKWKKSDAFKQLASFVTKP
eukprot:CAMPEP_0178415390 /NCGR_PEP_ID=MMETSP0689_2-20121128/23526_1 /TAXON_ID=160604 /ORGANISM="Amphidinium massartii, Strain CS-259" /LENGTH=143 /DNA_ID=CAMNT_0020036707 /DNA_START=25 /DNA_END=456 /DNA_ORIENTATION=+